MLIPGIHINVHTNNPLQCVARLLYPSTHIHILFRLPSVVSLKWSMIWTHIQTAMTSGGWKQDFFLNSGSLLSRFFVQVERITWDSTTKGPKTFITLLKAKHITQCSDSPLRLNPQIHKLQLHNMFAVKRSTDDKKIMKLPNCWYLLVRGNEGNE